MFDSKAFIDGLHSYLEKQFAPIVQRIKALEIRQPEKGDAGDQGEAGPQGPAGRDGVDGQNGLNGKDGQNGLNGENGLDGAPGKDGRDGFNGRDGKDGKDGKDGLNGRDGQNGRDGENGKPGLDGLDGKDGQDGVNGQDGLGFDDLNVVYDGARGFSIEFIQGERRKAFAFSLPVALYKGVYSDVVEYAPGDIVTFGGSLWHANSLPQGKPGISKEWQLAVKKGRDGKDGAPGAQGQKGEPGRDGHDLTQMNHRGEKW